MADCMNFPKRWEDFLHDYEFEDSRRIYTNGSWLIPSFRVKQMMEHYLPADVAPVRHAHWDVNGRCTACGGHAPYFAMSREYYKSPFCHECGAKMDEEVRYVS